MSLATSTTTAVPPGAHRTGTTLWHAGGARRPLRVLTGAVMLCSQSGPDLAALAVFLPGDVVMSHPHVAGTSLIVLTDCTVGPARLQDDDAVAAARSLLFERVVACSTEKTFLASVPRAARLLLRLHEAAPTDTRGRRWICVRQDVLAAAIGVRRETLASCVLTPWREAGWIETRYRRLCLRDADAVRRFAGEEVRRG